MSPHRRAKLERTLEHVRRLEQQAAANEATRATLAAGEAELDRLLTEAVDDDVSVTDAAAAAGVHRQTVYAARKRHAARQEIPGQTSITDDGQVAPAVPARRRRGGEGRTGR